MTAHYYDEPTITAYNQQAGTYAESHHTQLPTTIYRLINSFFKQNSYILDIGCGSGRDTNWLTQQGFHVTGVDASQGMLHEAKSRYAHIQDRFFFDSLPSLPNTYENAYDGVLCNAVMMHLPKNQIFRSTQTIAKKLKDNGVLIISYRNNITPRDEAGRLFTTIHYGDVIQMFEMGGLTLLQTINEPDVRNADLQWTILVFVKSHVAITRGLHVIQQILAEDDKNTTYKFAFIRSLCRIASNKDQNIIWDGDFVRVPMFDIIIEWIKCYWPIVMHSSFISQGYNDEQKNIVIRSKLSEIKVKYNFTSSDLKLFLDQIDVNPNFYKSLFTDIERSIVEGPIKHSGGAGNNNGFNIFQYDKIQKTVKIPVGVWLDIFRFVHWIEASIVIRWYELTVRFNQLNTKQSNDSQLILDLLLRDVTDDRTTDEIRSFFFAGNNNLNPLIYCVWTGEALNANNTQIDHVIPFKLFGNNDLWNLLPASAKVNNAKSAKLPSDALVYKRQNQIIEYWTKYHIKAPQRFTVQIQRALSNQLLFSQYWQEDAIAALIRKLHHVENATGAPRWEP